MAVCLLTLSLSIEERIRVPVADILGAESRITRSGSDREMHFLDVFIYQIEEVYLFLLVLFSCLCFFTNQKGNLWVVRPFTNIQACHLLLESIEY